MQLVASLNPTLQLDAFTCRWRPCGVTWDAVPKQLWFLKLLRKPAFTAQSGLFYDQLLTCLVLSSMQAWRSHIFFL